MFPTTRDYTGNSLAPAENKQYLEYFIRISIASAENKQFIEYFIRIKINKNTQKPRCGYLLPGIKENARHNTRILYFRICRTYIPCVVFPRNLRQQHSYNNMKDIGEAHCLS